MGTEYVTDNWIRICTLLRWTHLPGLFGWLFWDGYFEVYFPYGDLETTSLNTTFLRNTNKSKYVHSVPNRIHSPDGK